MPSADSVHDTRHEIVCTQMPNAPQGEIGRIEMSITVVVVKNKLMMASCHDEFNSHLIKKRVCGERERIVFNIYSSLGTWAYQSKLKSFLKFYEYLYNLQHALRMRQGIFRLFCLLLCFQSFYIPSTWLKSDVENKRVGF